jgi:uncharacterized protein (TIRG00374 family)
MKISKILQTLAGLALAAGGLYIFFRSSGGEEAIFKTLVRDISNASVTAVLVCFCLAVLSIYFRALRWRITLPDIGAPAHKKGFFAIVAVSLMLNNILPARLGEAARAVLLWKRNGYPVATSIGSLILERALDVMAYLLFLFVPVFMMPPLAAALRAVHPIALPVVWASFAAFVVMALMFLLYAVRPRWFRAIALNMIGRLPQKISAPARKIGAELKSNLNWVFSARKVLCVAALSAATALCYSSMLLALAWGTGAVGFLDSLFAQAFAACGAAIPLAPGAVGTLHAVLLQGLVIAGMEAGKARALVVLYHAVGYVAHTAIGLAFFLTLNVKFKDITESPGN